MKQFERSTAGPAAMEQIRRPTAGPAAATVAKQVQRLNMGKVAMAKRAQAMTLGWLGTLDVAWQGQA